VDEDDTKRVARALGVPSVSRIKRYEIEYNARYDDITHEENEDGDWVEFEDHEREVEALTNKLRNATDEIMELESELLEVREREE